MQSMWASNNSIAVAYEGMRPAQSAVSQEVFENLQINCTDSDEATTFANSRTTTAYCAPDSEAVCSRSFQNYDMIPNDNIQNRGFTAPYERRPQVNSCHLRRANSFGNEVSYDNQQPLEVPSEMSSINTCCTEASGFSSLAGSMHSGSSFTMSTAASMPSNNNGSAYSSFSRCDDQSASSFHSSNARMDHFSAAPSSAFSQAHRPLPSHGFPAFEHRPSLPSSDPPSSDPPMGDLPMGDPPLGDGLPYGDGYSEAGRAALSHLADCTTLEHFRAAFVELSRRNFWLRARLSDAEQRLRDAEAAAAARALAAAAARPASRPAPPAAAASSSSSSSPPAAAPRAGEPKGRFWSGEEHRRFLEGLRRFGCQDSQAIARHVGTRTATQVRTHAQKYFLKVGKAPAKTPAA